MTFMAPHTRTVYLSLVILSGVLYFLYVAYTSVYDGYLYRTNSSSNRGLALSNFNELHGKDEVFSNSTFSSNTSSINSSDIKSISNGVNKIVQPSVSSSKSPSPQQNVKSQNVIQKIPLKNENASLDYIVQGVKTRTVYDSGFIIPNIEICPDLGKDLQIVIIITSAPKHSQARMAIRQTWGHYQQRSDITIVFLLGTTLESNIQPDIQKEAQLYNDIIQGKFVDSYSNLTLKSVAMLEWVDNYCFQSKFILKTDDDMFINIPKLLNFISKHLKDKKKIFGRLARKWKPIRNKSSKYYVSPQQYRQPLFPDFTTGPAYLLTNDVIHDLYITALDKTYLKLEDVYTTGIVAQDNKIQRVHVNEFFNKRVALNPCNIQKSISIHMIKPFEQYDLWKKLSDGRSKC